MPHIMRLNQNYRKNIIYLINEKVKNKHCFFFYYYTTENIPNKNEYLKIQVLTKNSFKLTFYILSI